MAVLLLIAAILLGLVMIPFGFPGTLVIFAAALCYYLLVPGGAIGLATVVGVGILMLVARCSTGCSRGGSRRSTAARSARGGVRSSAE